MQVTPLPSSLSLLGKPFPKLWRRAVRRRLSTEAHTQAARGRPDRAAALAHCGQAGPGAGDVVAGRPALKSGYCASCRLRWRYGDEDTGGAGKNLKILEVSCQRRAWHHNGQAGGADQRACARGSSRSRSRQHETREGALAGGCCSREDMLNHQAGAAGRPRCRPLPSGCRARPLVYSP